jgi:hypothetical protein
MNPEPKRRGETAILLIMFISRNAEKSLRTNCIDTGTAFRDNIHWKWSSLNHSISRSRKSPKSNHWSSVQINSVQFIHLNAIIWKSNRSEFFQVHFGSWLFYGFLRKFELTFKHISIKLFHLLVKCKQVYILQNYPLVRKRFIWKLPLSNII